MKALPLALFVFGLGACAGAQHPVEVKGGDADLVKLAGDWTGSYTGIESGRSGAVQFSLELGRHTADGKVLLDGATPLAIEFVDVQAGQVSGKMQPYTDPSCKCEVQTDFIGNLDGDSITGTFTTTVVGKSDAEHGEWSVARK